MGPANEGQYTCVTEKTQKQTCLVCNWYILGTPQYLSFTAKCIPRVSFLVYGLVINLFEPKFPLATWQLGYLLLGIVGFRKFSRTMF